MDIKQANIEKFLVLAAYTVTVEGGPVDLRDYDAEGQLVLMSAAGAGTGPTLDVTFEEADIVGGPWTAAPGLAFAQVTDAADAMEMIPITPSRYKRYLRAVPTVGGTTPSFDAGLCMVAPKKFGRNASQAV